jgi:feruloyl esterase
MRYRRLSFLACLCGWPALAQQTCESLIGLKLPHTTVTSATSVAGTASIPAHCAVQATARPTSDSEIKFELWLPASEWNGKYEQVGNGGWAGSIPVSSLAEPLRRGFAAAGTDDGHLGGNAEWAIGHPEKLADFGYRAVHETRLQSLAIVQAFYGKDTSHNYFFGCSDGGREALMEAQRFADDFDGIIAGAPANNWTHLMAAALWDERALLDDPASAIPQSKLPAIQKAAVEQCDALDGVKDGLIEDPRACHFDPGTIACKGADSSDCLTVAQVAALRRIYAGPKNPRTGEQIFPGYSPGAENATWRGWMVATPQASPAQFMFANTFYLQAVYGNLKQDFHALNFDTDVAYGDEKVGPLLNSTNPDLRSYRARGGRLIQYHGWGDAAIPAQDSIDYYEMVRAFMMKFPNGPGNSPGPIDDFYRLFLVPGMGHCGGGIGPNVFGNGNTVAGAKTDPERDLMTALDLWVEKGIAPDHFVGTGKVVGDPAKVLTRPLCVYPKTARYNGTGDINVAASFTCASQ